jgi:poly-beta-1,6-N-acetyl-D-glucosamine synthase
MMVVLLSCLFVVCYALVLLPAGWNIYFSKRKTEKTSATVLISVLIPVRNEVTHIFRLLDLLRQQSYRHAEYLVIDDHSDDATVLEVERFQHLFPDFPLRLLVLENTQSGKKAALTQGVNEARGELIVTTDADVWPQQNWLTVMAQAYEQTDAGLLVGGVGIRAIRPSSFLETVQTIEQTALQAFAGGWLLAGVPVLCSGANLAYPKKVFEQVNGYSGDTVTSGDDLFLMQRIKRWGKRKIQWVEDGDVLVETAASSSWQAFVQQRKRWSGKFFHYRSMPSFVAGSVVFVVQLLVLVGIGLCFLSPPFGLAGLILVFGKVLTDVLFLYLAAAFFRKPFLPLISVLYQIPYALLSIAVVLLGLSSTYFWKDRPHRI